MTNDQIYSKSTLEDVGIFKEAGNQFQREWILTPSCIASIFSYRKDDFTGISLFIAGGGNIILKDVSMDEFCNALHTRELYYVYSDKYEKWFIYLIE